jgi:hypothetical protein
MLIKRKFLLNLRFYSILLSIFVAAIFIAGCSKKQSTQNKRSIIKGSDTMVHLMSSLKKLMKKNPR